MCTPSSDGPCWLLPPEAHLVDDLPGAQRVVADLTVAHVRVAGQPDRRPMSLHRPARPRTQW